MATGIEPGGNHALAVGMVHGALMKAFAEDGHHYKIEPVMDGSDYTKALLLTGPSGTKFIVEITPQESY